MLADTVENRTLLNLISIQCALGVGTISAYNTYLAVCEAGLLDANYATLRNNSNLPKSYRDKLLRFKRENAEKILERCKERNIKIICISDIRFPERLRNIPTPALVLYLKGELPDIDNEPVISIVGPRKLSDFGERAAYSLAKRLSRAGFIVVSGGAMGGDSAAHRGALEGGKTIAVLGCGLEYDYLPQNRGLRRKIAENCCLISEYPPDAPTSKFSFPIRNRLISGLSLGTVVIEAKIGSGTLITARHANEQGRDVFVIPGNPTDEHYKGSNDLLRDGAKPLINAADIFGEYIRLFPDKINIERAFEKEKEEENPKIQKKSDKGLSNEAKIVYNYLDKQNFTADDLLGCGITTDEILSAITELELEHYIKALPGGNYVMIKP